MAAQWGAAHINTSSKVPLVAEENLAAVTPVIGLAELVSFREKQPNSYFYYCILEWLLLTGATPVESLAPVRN